MEAIFALFGLFVVALIGFVIWSQVRLAQRATALVQLAPTLGLTYQKVPKQPWSLGILVNEGGNPRQSHFMEGRLEGLHLRVFDHRARMGAGATEHVAMQTVAVAEAADAKLPTFLVRPKSVNEWLSGRLSGHPRVELDGHPEFSKGFLLASADPDEIAKTFDPQVVEFFTSRPGIAAEGADGWVMVYRPRKVRWPEEIRPLMDEAKELSRRLRRAAPARAG